MAKRVRIWGEGPTGDTYNVSIDGERVECSAVSCYLGVGERNEVTITIPANDIDIDIEADEIEHAEPDEEEDVLEPARSH